MVTFDYFGTLIGRADLLRLSGKRICPAPESVETPSPNDRTANFSMSPHAHLAYEALWFAHPVLQLLLVGVILWRKLHRTFPIFFSYVAFQIAVFALTFSLRNPRFYTVFYYTYWGTNAVSIVLGFCVIHEVFQDVFRPYHTLRDLGTVLFKWAALVMLLVAGVVAASTATATEDPIPTAIMTLARSVRVVQCGLVLFLLVFSRYLGTTWRQKSFGIALGFGAFAGVELSLVALNASTGDVFNQVLSSFINMSAYNITILIWAWYMLVKSPARQPASHMLRPQRWEEGLTAIQHPQSPDSLIPMFESMVDRALSRTGNDSMACENTEQLAGSTADGGRRRVRLEYPALPQRVGSK